MLFEPIMLCGQRGRPTSSFGIWETPSVKDCFFPIGVGLAFY